MPAPIHPQANLPPLDARLLEQLACPVCFRELHLASDGTAIVCAGCGQSYPIVDGIPVLIASKLL